MQPQARRKLSALIPERARKISPMTNTWRNEIMARADRWYCTLAAVAISSSCAVYCFSLSLCFVFLFLFRSLSLPFTIRPLIPTRIHFPLEALEQMGQRSPVRALTPSFNCLAFQFLWTTSKWMQKEGSSKCSSRWATCRH